MAADSKRLASFHDNKQMPEVMERLNEQRKLSRFCDVVLKVCGEQIFAHSNILASASEYFSSFLGCGQDWPRAFSQKTPQIIEIYIDGCEGDGKGYGEAVRKVVDFMYTSKIDISDEILNQVIEIAKIMQMNKIMEYCEKFQKSEVTEGDLKTSGSDNHLDFEDENEGGGENEDNDPDYEAPKSLKEGYVKKKSVRKRGRPRKNLGQSKVHLAMAPMPSEDEFPEDENLCVVFDKGNIGIDESNIENDSNNDKDTTMSSNENESDKNKKPDMNESLANTTNTDTCKLEPSDPKPTRYSKRVRKVKAHPDYVTHHSSLLKPKKEVFESEERENKPIIDSDVKLIVAYMCKACKLSFKSMEEYKKHKLSVHTSIPPRKELSCTKCEFTTKRQSEYKEHMKTHLHNELTCSYCEYHAVDQTDFELHIKRHSGEFPYFCMECDARFKNRAQQNAHMPKHSVVKPFVCEICNAGFKWKHALKSHMITHSDTKDHLCDICGFATAHKSMLKAHKLIHSGNTFKCEVLNCNFQATKKQNLKYHMLTHSGEKPHQCEICGQSFSLVKNMKRHMLMHSSDKPIKCDFQDCHFATTRFDKLKEHKLKQHGTGQPPTKKLRLSDYENMAEGHHIIHLAENQILSEALAAAHNIQEGQIIATVDSSGSIIGHVQYAEIDSASGIIQYVTSVE